MVHNMAAEDAAAHPYVLDADQLAQWEEDGMLLLTEVLTEDDVDSLEGWCNEVAGWEAPPDGVPGLYTLHYELAHGERVLCRVENYTPFHAGFRRVAEERLAPVIEQLLGEPAVLYKEKINLKMPGGKGYAPHYDGPSAASLGLATTFITAQVAIDTQTTENGCLEVVRPRSACPPAAMVAPVADGDPDGNGRVGAIAPSLVSACTWSAVEAPRGSVLLFHGLLPHRSGPNRTDRPRRTAYMLFNPASEGQHHEEYYALMEEARARWRAKRAAAAAAGGASHGTSARTSCASEMDGWAAAGFG